MSSPSDPSQEIAGYHVYWKVIASAQLPSTDIDAQGPIRDSNGVPVMLRPDTDLDEWSAQLPRGHYRFVPVDLHGGELSHPIATERILGSGQPLTEYDAIAADASWHMLTSPAAWGPRLRAEVERATRQVFYRRHATVTSLSTLSLQRLPRAPSPARAPLSSRSTWTQQPASTTRGRSLPC